MAVGEDDQDGEMRETEEEGSVEMGAVTLSLICELERTHTCTLNGYKQTYVFFNTITLSRIS